MASFVARRAGAAARFLSSKAAPAENAAYYNWRTGFGTHDKVMFKPTTVPAQQSLHQATGNHTFERFERDKTLNWLPFSFFVLCMTYGIVGGSYDMMYGHNKK